MGKYVNQDNFIPSDGMIMEEDDIVDRDGYRDTEDIVNEFIRAGERLAQFRREEFDAEYGDTEVELNPMRDQNFDAAEASMMLEAEAKRIASLSMEEEKVVKVEKEEEVKEVK